MKTIKQKVQQIKWRVWFRDIMILIVAICAITAWQSKDMLDSDGTIKVKDQLLVSLDGQTTQLLNGNGPTLVYFFAPWCNVCSLSIGNLAYLNPEKLNIVRVALDYSSVEDVQRFVSENDVSGSVLLGHVDLKTDFKIQGYPSYYLLDERHRVVGSSFGYSTALGLKLREAFGRF